MRRVPGPPTAAARVRQTRCTTPRWPRPTSSVRRRPGARGLRPAPEIQFFDYIWPAIPSRSRARPRRSAGGRTVPSPARMVLRVPIGGYLTGGAIWHSQCGESIFAHVPGLVGPSRHGRATPSASCAPPSGPRTRCCSASTSTSSASPRRRPVPGRRPRRAVRVGCVRRLAGTVVTWGATVQKSLVVATGPAADADRGGAGREVEVIDLRTISPWDHELVADSVRRTGRPGRPRGRPHRRLGRRGGGVDRRRGCSATSRRPVRRVAAQGLPRGLGEPTLETPSSRRWPTSRAAARDPSPSEGAGLLLEALAAAVARSLLTLTNATISRIADEEDAEPVRTCGRCQAAGDGSGRRGGEGHVARLRRRRRARRGGRGPSPGRGRQREAVAPVVGVGDVKCDDVEVLVVGDAHRVERLDVLGRGRRSPGLVVVLRSKVPKSRSPEDEDRAVVAVDVAAVRAVVDPVVRGVLSTSSAGPRRLMTSVGSSTGRSG